jgi:putative sterol carrier protein
MTSSAKEAIEALPAAFLPEKAGAVKALFQLDLTGDQGGQWVLDVAEGKCEVREETAEQSDAKLTMDANDFAALFQNELDPVRAFMAGKIKVSGNLGLVMQLLNWFDRGA